MNIKTIQVVMGAITALVITAGGALGMAFLALHGGMPDVAVWVGCIVLGLVAAAKDTRSQLALPPLSNGNMDALKQLYGQSPPQPQQQPAQQGNDSMKTIVSIIAIATLAATLTGCTFKRETTTINTPAVYAVTKDANGVLQSNLVSAASVKTTVEKERIWLPKGYAVTHNTVMYGVDVSMTDATTQTPKVRAGIVDDSWRWIPSDTNKLYAPPITASAELNNKAIPFSLGGKGRFTSGETQVSVSDTNATASAIVPGTPADQK